MKDKTLKFRCYKQKFPPRSVSSILKQQVQQFNNHHNNMHSYDPIFIDPFSTNAHYAVQS